MAAVRLERRWLILAFSVAYSSFTLGLLSGFTFWVGPWNHDFGVPRSLIMSVYASASVLMVICYPLAGRVLDYLSVRACLALGAALVATGLTLATLAPSFWLVFAAYALFMPLGLILAGYLPATVIDVRLFPGRTGLINGLMAVGTGLSGAVMAAFAAPLIAAAGWRGMFLTAAGLFAAVIGPTGWVLMNVPEGAPARTLKPAASEGLVSAEGFSALRRSGFWAVLIAMLPVLFVISAIPVNLTAIAADAGLNPAHAAVLFSVLSGATAVGSLAGGWMSDRLGSRTVYVSLLVIVVMVLLVLAQRPSLAVLSVALAAFGAAGGALLPWMGATVMRIFGPEAFARVLSLLTPFFVPASFAPVLFGWIRDTTGSYRDAFLLFALLLTPGCLSLLLIRPPAKSAAVAAE
jgi:MFS transporter, OFA family, oxalate/formate antiporter